MKLAIFQRSTSKTRPDAHVIAVSVIGIPQIAYTNHEAQHMMEQIGMILDHGEGWLTIDFGLHGERRIPHKYANQLVNDLQIALQAWANYEGS